MNRILIAVLAFILGIGMGGIGGFFVGAAVTDAGSRLLKDLTASEQPADINNPQIFSRKKFSVEVAGNWKEDVEMEGYQAESLFMFVSPNNNSAHFTIYDMPVEPVEELESQVEYVKESLRDVKATPFTKWGRYTGQGMKLEGKWGGVYPFVTRVFCHSTDDEALLVYEQYNLEDEAKTQPGYKLIEQTFKLKNP